MSIAALALLGTTAPATAATLGTAFMFNGSNGAAPTNGNLLYLNGAVYSATQAGGGNDLGAITSVSTDGQSTSAVLYSFSGPDGSHPNGSLVADAQGNLYGSTQDGGANGFGTIFKLINPHTGATPWQLVTLRSFGCNDGAYPQAGVTLGPDGSLYGTTYGQGNGCAVSNFGAVWKLTGSNFRIMHAFNGFYFQDATHPAPPDGGNPRSNIVLDPSGVMIGTTTLGWPYHFTGSLFAISPSGAYTLVTSFNQYVSGGPVGNIARDSAGNVYGTVPSGTGYNGAPSGATVFKVTAVTHNQIFLANMPGEFTESGVILDRAGNLYGTLTGYQYPGGGLGRNGGGVFSVSSTGTLTRLASLGFDNQGPVGGVVLDSAGNLWGTSSAGGIRCASNPSTSGCGTIFELTP